MKTYQGTYVIQTRNKHHKVLLPVFRLITYPLLCTSRTSGPSVAGLETTYSGGNGFSTSYNSQRWLNLYLSACKLLDLALALPPESLPQFQMSVPTSLAHNIQAIR